MSKVKKSGAGPAKSASSKAAPAKAVESKAVKTPSKAPGGGDRGRYLAPVYLASLVLVFLGERVFATFELLRYAVTGLGVLGAAGATAARFVLAQDTEGERRQAERALGLFSVGGLFALLAYFATTETGRNLFGITKMAAAGRARVETALTIAWVVLVILSVLPLLFGERALAPMRKAPHFEARRVKAATISGMTLALAVTYCMLFTYAAGELELKADYSYFRTAQASESTKNIAQSLPEKVTVTAFFPQLNEVAGEVEGYMRDAGKNAPNFQFEVQDRLLGPALAKEAKVTQDGVIVLSRGESRETLTLGTDMKGAMAKLKSLDVDFQKALLKVMRSARIAYLTVTHGEMNDPSANTAEGRSAKGIRKLLESQNYTVKELGLAQGLGSEIPSDAFLVVVLGPAKAFLPEEIGALKRYTEKGGKLLMGLDPDGKADVAPLADIVDLTWDPVVLATEKNLVRRRFNPSDRTILVTTRFSSHASVSTLSRNAQRAPVILPGASALDKKPNADSAVDFAVKTLADAFPDTNGDFAQQKESEKAGTFNVAAAVTKKVAAAAGKDGKDGDEMRAFVVGDADCFSDAALGHEPNILFTLDVLRWLGGEESFSGAVSTAEDVRIEHTKEKDLIWFYGTIFGAPAVVLGAGLWNVRRMRQKAKGRRS